MLYIWFDTKEIDYSNVAQPKSRQTPRDAKVDNGAKLSLCINGIVCKADVKRMFDDGW